MAAGAALALSRHAPARNQQREGGADEYDGRTQLGEEEEVSVDYVGDGVAGAAWADAAAAASELLRGGVVHVQIVTKTQCGRRGHVQPVGVQTREGYTDAEGEEDDGGGGGDLQSEVTAFGI
jgi:hypothetical protein